MNNWDAYLESLCTAYAKWWEIYTLMDVVSCIRAEPEQSALLSGFNLMVQTLQPSGGEAPEKIERFGVLFGLRKYAKEHVLLVGQPGAGKSTALVRLLLLEAQKAKRDRQALIPVLLELRYYQTSVLDLMQNFLQRHRLLLDNAEIEQLLKQRQLLLLVDGFNELPSLTARQELIAFRQKYPATEMVFTTWDLGGGGDLNIAKKLVLQPSTLR